MTPSPGFDAAGDGGKNVLRGRADGLRGPELSRAETATSLACQQGRQQRWGGRQQVSLTIDEDEANDQFSLATLATEPVYSMISRSDSPSRSRRPLEADLSIDWLVEGGIDKADSRLVNERELAELRYMVEGDERFARALEVTTNKVSAMDHADGEKVLGTLACLVWKSLCIAWELEAPKALPKERLRAIVAQLEDELKLSQETLGSCRRAYFKELVCLRDQIRTIKTEWANGIRAVVYDDEPVMYYEPIKFLDEGQREFLAEIVEEKLKLLLKKLSEEGALAKEPASPKRRSTSADRKAKDKEEQAHREAEKAAMGRRLKDLETQVSELHSRISELEQSQWAAENEMDEIMAAARSEYQDLAEVARSLSTGALSPVVQSLGGEQVRTAIGEAMSQLSAPPRVARAYEAPPSAPGIGSVTDAAGASAAFLAGARTRAEYVIKLTKQGALVRKELKNYMRNSMEDPDVLAKMAAAAGLALTPLGAPPVRKEPEVAQVDRVAMAALEAAMAALEARNRELEREVAGSRAEAQKAKAALESEKADLLKKLAGHQRKLDEVAKAATGGRHAEREALEREKAETAGLAAELERLRPERDRLLALVDGLRDEISELQSNQKRRLLDVVDDPGNLQSRTVNWDRPLGKVFERLYDDASERRTQRASLVRNAYVDREERVLQGLASSMPYADLEQLFEGALDVQPGSGGASEPTLQRGAVMTEHDRAATLAAILRGHAVSSSLARTPFSPRTSLVGIGGGGRRYSRSISPPASQKLLDGVFFTPVSPTQTWRRSMREDLATILPSAEDMTRSTDLKEARVALRLSSFPSSRHLPRTREQSPETERPPRQTTSLAKAAAVVAAERPAQVAQESTVSFNLTSDTPVTANDSRCLERQDTLLPIEAISRLVENAGSGMPSVEVELSRSRRQLIIAKASDLSASYAMAAEEIAVANAIGVASDDASARGPWSVQVFREESRAPAGSILVSSSVSKALSGPACLGTSRPAIQYGDLDLTIGGSRVSPSGACSSQSGQAARRPTSASASVRLSGDPCPPRPISAGQIWRQPHARGLTGAVSGAAPRSIFLPRPASAIGSKPAPLPAGLPRPKSAILLSSTNVKPRSSEQAVAARQPRSAGGPLSGGALHTQRPSSATAPLDRHASAPNLPSLLQLASAK